jgi:hypothetical protein
LTLLVLVLLLGTAVEDWWRYSASANFIKFLASNAFGRPEFLPVDWNANGGKETSEQAFFVMVNVLVMWWLPLLKPLYLSVRGVMAFTAWLHNKYRPQFRYA